MPIRTRTLALTLLGAAALVAGLVAAPDPLRLYTLDCGTMPTDDVNALSDTEAYPESRRLTLRAPCFLIQHGDRYLLWDAGLPTEPVEAADAEELPTTDVALEPQLERLGLTPSDIDLVALSHVHFDHVGQAARFPEARLLVGAADYDLLFGNGPRPPGFIPALLAPWRDGQNVERIRGDHDVFGDGSVVMLHLPGHTPGHYALRLNLANAGPVVLSGDLYHFRDNRARRGVPDFNTDRAATLASFDRMEGYLVNSGARLVIQHDPDDYAALPKPPAYLD